LHGFQCCNVTGGAFAQKLKFAAAKKPAAADVVSEDIGI
jgi:hypothetical protein